MRLAWNALLFLAATSGAAAAPPSSQPQNQLDSWFNDLAKAGSPEEAKPIEDKIDAAFKQSGSASVDLLMSRANQALSAADNRTASALLTAVTKVAPRYAEGWHARATLEAADGDDSAAMLSLQRAVLLNSRAFSAMAELAEMLEDYGDKKGALTLYRKALALDPQLEGAARRIRALEKDVEGQGI